MEIDSDNGEKGHDISDIGKYFLKLLEKVFI